MTVSIGEGWLGGAHLVQRKLHSLVLSIPFKTDQMYVRNKTKTQMEPVFIQVVTFQPCSTALRMSAILPLWSRLEYLNDYYMDYHAIWYKLIHDLLRIHINNFGDSLAFHLAPLAAQICISLV